MSKSHRFNSAHRPIVFVITILACAICALPLLSRPAQATDNVTASTILKKTLANALKTCYSNVYTIKNGVTESFFASNGVNSILTEDGRNNRIIPVPSTLGSTSLSEAKVTCEEVFNGTNRTNGALWWANSESLPGLLSLYGKTTANLADFGYTLSSTSGETANGQGCVSVRYTSPDANGRSVEHTTNSVCFSLTNNGDIELGGYDSVAVNNDGDGGPISLYYNHTLGMLGYTQGNYDQAIASPANLNWNSFVSSVDTAFRSDIDPSWQNSQIFYQEIESQQETNGTAFSDYEKTSPTKEAALQALRYLTGDPAATWDSIKFTSDEELALLSSYAEQWQADGKIILDSACYGTRNEVSREYAIYTSNGWCGVQIPSSVNPNDSGVKYNIVNGTRSGLVPATMATVLRKLSEQNVATDDDGASAPGTIEDDLGSSTNDTNTITEVGSDLSACYDAAGVLGWFVCPVLEAVGGVASAVYDNIVENLLVVDPNWINENGTRSGWEIFRDIANLIFAILFIIVILSQVTGVGVSNYGIKKILPRLIAVAVLVNISFIICQLAVDLSNILGAGLNSLFTELAKTVATNDGGEVFKLGPVIRTIAQTAIGVTVDGIGFAALGYLAALNWDVWLWPLLLVLIGIVIGIIFFFILLGVRQAGVIILVALAPVAIVCYALPNTKKLFDRWLQIFVALLLLYPLCGILMGGGEFASTLIINNAGEGDIGFLLTLVAMLLSVVPFFFIPSLLRSSMNALGNLGTKISGFGSKLSSGATGALRRSERLQEWNKRNRVTGDYRRAQRTIERANRRGKALSPSQDRRIARAKAAMERQGKEDAANRLYAMRTGKQMEAAVAAAEAEAIEKDVQEAAAAFSTQFKNEGLDYNLDEMQRIHAEALTDLTRDPENREAKAKLIAAQNILAATDKGRGLMKNNFYSATDRLQASGTGHNDGFSWAARQLHREHGGAIKAHDRSFEKYLTDAGKDLSAVKGKFAAGTVGFDGDGKAIAGFASSHYDSSDISGYTASTLADIDEGALDRWIATAKTSALSQISDEDKARLISLTEDTLTNDNITVQPKIVEKLNTLRESLGEKPITPASRSAAPTDSGSLPVRTLTPAQAPIPDNATVTQNGLIITHGMTDRQIDEFARRMDQFNRQNNQNPQSNLTPQTNQPPQNNQPPSNQQPNTPPRP